MITYNGTDLSTWLNITINDIKRPILPPQKLSTMEIAGRDGAFYFRKVNGPYTIPVDVTLKGATQQELRANIRALADALYTETPQSTIFADEPDRYIMSTLQDESVLDEVYKTGKGTLKFFCPDPYYYAIADDIKTYNAPGAQSFTRQGTAPSFPRFEIQGTSMGGSISIVCNGKTMTYTGTLLATDLLVIDSTLITAYVQAQDGTKTPVMNKLNNLDFPVFGKGQVNVTFSVSGGATITQVIAHCNSRWR